MQAVAQDLALQVNQCNQHRPQHILQQAYALIWGHILVSARCLPQLWPRAASPPHSHSYAAWQMLLSRYKQAVPGNSAVRATLSYG